MVKAKLSRVWGEHQDNRLGKYGWGSHRFLRAGIRAIVQRHVVKARLWAQTPISWHLPDVCCLALPHQPGSHQSKFCMNKEQETVPSPEGLQHDYRLRDTDRDLSVHWENNWMVWEAVILVHQQANLWQEIFPAMIGKKKKKKSLKQGSGRGKLARFIDIYGDFLFCVPDLPRWEESSIRLTWKFRQLVTAGDSPQFSQRQVLVLSYWRAVVGRMEIQRLRRWTRNVRNLEGSTH